MSCEHYLDLISARLDGELSREEEAELSRHLGECPACRAISEDMKGLHSALSGLGEVPVPDGFADRVMERVRQDGQKKGTVPLFRRRTVRQLAGLAACLVLCLGLYQLAGRDAGTAGNAQNVSYGAQNYSAAPTLDRSLTGETSQLSPQTASMQSADPAGTADMAAKGSQENASGEPTHYSFENDQYLRVTWGATPAAPSARILGSVQSLGDFISRFPEDDLSAVTQRYGEDFFQTGCLLAVVLEESSGSVRHQIQAQGLLEGEVLIRRQVPETGTCDMAAWLILAEVTPMFEDGQELEVKLLG